MRNLPARSAWVLALCVCSGVHAEDADKQSRWSIFWHAMQDAVAGAPNASALAERRRFDEAGIAFEYPAPLHVSRDADGDRNWTLTYGDFDLDVYAYTEEGVDAGAYLGALASVLGTEKANVETPADDASVTWCGRSITPVRMRLNLLGDRHDFRGYDLPAPAGETRFLVFDDVLVDGEHSKQAEAAHAMVAETLRCEAAAASGEHQES